MLFLQVNMRFVSHPTIRPGPISISTPHLILDAVIWSCATLCDHLRPCGVVVGRRFSWNLGSEIGFDCGVGLCRGIDVRLDSGLRSSIGVGHGSNSGCGDTSSGVGHQSERLLYQGGRHHERHIAGFFDHVPHPWL